jgi:hypothetical protein
VKTFDMTIVRPIDSDRVWRLLSVPSLIPSYLNFVAAVQRVDQAEPVVGRFDAILTLNYRRVFSGQAKVALTYQPVEKTITIIHCAPSLVPLKAVCSLEVLPIGTLFRIHCDYEPANFAIDFILSQIMRSGANQIVLAVERAANQL